MTRVKLNMEVNLKDLRNETLFELIKVSVDILKERSNAAHSNELLNKSSDDHLNTKKKKRGPYKKSIAKGVVATSKKTEEKRHYKKRQSKDYTELDKIIKKHYGKKSLKEIAGIAAEKGITTDTKQIDYRRWKLRITPLRNFARPKKTDDLNLIEEASELNLEGIEGQKNLNDSPGGEDE